MKDIVLGLLAIVSVTLWTAFSFGAVSYAVRLGWILAGGS